MEMFILIGHGSPKNSANNLDLISKMLHARLHPGCTNQCVIHAYLQFATPTIDEAISLCVARGAKKIVLHPFFLSAGMHVTKDIPEMISHAKSLYPNIDFSYTEPLGIHEKLIDAMMDRVKASGIASPQQIEQRSFEIISENIDPKAFDKGQLAILQRVIHATADFEFADNMIFHPDAVKTGIDALKSGKDILVDVQMLKAGIKYSVVRCFGCKILCHINDDDVMQLSQQTGKTRSELAIQKSLAKGNNIGIIAIGNAPTALLKVIEILNDSDAIDKPLVIGVPVGFVNAIESKILLCSAKFPYITNLSKKGGSPVAAAVVNALVKLAI